MPFGINSALEEKMNEIVVGLSGVKVIAESTCHGKP